MIPVQLQPEPVGFDVNVRRKGQGWLIDHGLGLCSSAPPKTKLPAYWNSALHQAMRARHFAEYIAHGHQQTLKKYSPFVWYEANRQGLL